jgi:cell fate regulator YaaT (PSP1 superfamily)
MPEIVGVRFRNAGKVYYFDPDGREIAKGTSVIVETARGVECGDVVIANRDVRDDEHTQPLKKVLREATEADLEQVSRNQDKEAYALKVCGEKIRKHKLDMKLIGAEYTFDNSKVLFYFTADGRVDFRELVKDLASVLRTRIELRQVGVRDEAKMLGGLGYCGRPFCCATFLGEFQPVSIKMAKEQGLSLNPTKISGTCGRLMCCLKYEQEAYEELARTTPRQGTTVQTPEGQGVINEVSLLTGMLKVSVEQPNGQGHNIVSVHKSQVKPLRDRVQRPAPNRSEDRREGSSPE